MQDSLMAGNCEAGTVSFVRQHFGFTPTKEDYISGICGQKLLDTGSALAKMAVIIAVQRQLLETI